MRRPFRSPRHRGATHVLLAAIALTCAGCDRSKVEPGATRGAPATTEPADETRVDSFEVVKIWPHDRSSYTQGLLFHDGYLYESTGLVGFSSLRKVDIATGKAVQRVEIDEPYFAEGLAILRGELYQLTWTTQKGFVYALDTMQKVREFNYRGEGWGLTSDGKSLIASNGSNVLQFFDPNDAKSMRSISVTFKGRALRNLNELEYIKGEIYANVWHSNRIVRIDPVSGKILGWVDLTALVPPEFRADRENTLNGIAYDAKSDRLFVTGKRWPNVFEIRVKRI